MVVASLHRIGKNPERQIDCATLARQYIRKSWFD